MCRTATLSLRFLLFLNFKPFIIFVSDKKFNCKIEESKQSNCATLILSFRCFVSRLSFKSTADNIVELSEKRTSGTDTYWATFDPKAFPVPWQTDGRVTLPAQATPAEIAGRFQEVCKKTVDFIYFQDNVPKVENSWDFNLNYSQFTLPPPFEMYKQADSSFLVNASATFTQWTFCFLLQLLEFCLVSTATFYFFNVYTIHLVVYLLFSIEYTIPYHTIPYHTIPYHTIPYHTIPYHTYHTIPYHTILYHTISYHTISYVPYYTIPHHIPYNAMLYYIIPHHTT